MFWSFCFQIIFIRVDLLWRSKVNRFRKRKLISWDVQLPIHFSTLWVCLRSSVFHMIVVYVLMCINCILMKTIKTEYLLLCTVKFHSWHRMFSLEANTLLEYQLITFAFQISVGLLVLLTFLGIESYIHTRRPKAFKGGREKTKTWTKKPRNTSEKWFPWLGNEGKELKMEFINLSFYWLQIPMSFWLTNHT